MLDQVLSVFDISPDTDLNLMRPEQTLNGLASRAIEALDALYSREKPDLVLVQGDTTTVFCAALAAFHHRVPVGHVEAGLRTGDLSSPWPEEANRILTSRLATLHFAPTEMNRRNLLREAIASDRIFVTGNTVIDALLMALQKVKEHPPDMPGISARTVERWYSGASLVLITGHRRENFGRGLEAICQAIAELANRFPETDFVYPVHLNPNVRRPVHGILGRGKHRNIHLIEPLPYLAFVAMMHHATIILTDSGGVQEEAPSLAKPVLVMRDRTERPEAVSAGNAMVVGTDSDRIVEEASKLMTDSIAYKAMARAHNPYGDGRASGRILEVCGRFLSG